MVEHTSEVNTVAVVLGVALMMIGAGLAKKQLDWRPLRRRIRRLARLRREAEQREKEDRRRRRAAATVADGRRSDGTRRPR